jgi:hypothetical protein
MTTDSNTDTSKTPESSEGDKNDTRPDKPQPHDGDDSSLAFLTSDSSREHVFRINTLRDKIRENSGTLQPRLGAKK